MQSADRPRLRAAVLSDVPKIVDLIGRLAEYEHLTHENHADEGALREHLFGERRYVEALIAEVRDEAVGYALFFHTYSTFLTKPGIWLEDLFVVPEQRRNGVGKALLARLAEIAVERGCGRVEWSVLHWNEPAIGFYRGLGARPCGDWTTYRLTGDALQALGGFGGSR